MNRFAGPTGSELRFESVGDGPPILALHGAYSAHEEIRAILESALVRHSAYRRIYPDLPGMGDSPPHEMIRSANDVVDLLDQFVQAEIGDSPFLLAGHSFGGHLARGLAARRTTQVAGMLLICPVMPTPTTSEAHVVVTADGDPADWFEPSLVAEYTAYFVIHTRVTAERFRQAVAPVIGRFDGASVEQIMTNAALDPEPDSVPIDQPTLIVTARHDAFVGYRDQLALLDTYPRASYVTVADAGHAVAHEHPHLIAELVNDWLARC